MIKNVLEFVQNGKIVRIDFSNSPFHPSTTVLNYLRANPETRGTKEGCAEGDCGACTVVLGELKNNGTIAYKAADSCVMFLPSLHGRQLITVENLSQNLPMGQEMHKVQQSLVEEHGSQCGFCTPGFVMTSFAMYKNRATPDRKTIVESMAGNLCRCTGYESIYRATEKSLANFEPDQFDTSENTIKNLLVKIKTQSQGIEIYTKNQHYWLPESLRDALAIKAQHPDALVVLGSTDVAVKQNKTFVFPYKILDLSHVEELNKISEHHGLIRIGAGTSLEEVKNFAAQRFPSLMPVLEHFASLQIRNMASIAGNICNASPVGDLIPMMFALKATVVLQNHKGQRMVDIEQFIEGYRKTCLQPDELLVEIDFPQLNDNEMVRFEKVSTRKHVDISTVSLASRLVIAENGTVKEILLAYGGMAAMVKRASSAEQFLLHKELTESNIKKASELISEDFTPISDARSDKEYRMRVAGNLVLKCLL
jgi:xanthine dehydrogenase small subunit